jgi:hypothetical protein
MTPNAAPRVAAAAAAAEQQQPASELDAGRPRHGQGQGPASEPLEPLDDVGTADLAFPYTRAQYVPQAPRRARARAAPLARAAGPRRRVTAAHAAR